MNRLLLPAATLAALCFAAPALAADGNRPKPGGEEFRKRILEKFDKNGNGQLDADEKEAAKAEFAKRRPGGDKPGFGGKPGEGREAILKKFDKNGDGKLDEAEREAAKKELGARRPGGPGGPSREELLKKFDKNGDGKLDDSEREAAKAEFQKRRAEKEKQ